MPSLTWTLGSWLQLEMSSKTNQEEWADLLQRGWNPKASSFKEREVSGSHTCLPSASAFQLLRPHTPSLRSQVLFHIALAWQCQIPATWCSYRKLYSYVGFVPRLRFRLVPFSSWHQGKHAFQWWRVSGNSSDLKCTLWVLPGWERPMMPGGKGYWSRWEL